jgi:hypothetical protein
MNEQKSEEKFTATMQGGTAERLRSDPDALGGSDRRCTVPTRWLRTARNEKADPEGGVPSEPASVRAFSAREASLSARRPDAG